MPLSLTTFMERRESVAVTAMPDPDHAVSFLVGRLVIGVVAVAGNAVILFIFCRFRAFRRQFSNWLIFFLAVADFLNGCGLLLRAAYSTTGSAYGEGGYHRTPCALVASPQGVGVLWGYIVFFGIASDRLVAVQAPGKYNSWRIEPRVALLLVAWAVAAAIFLAVLFSTLPSRLSAQCSLGSIASEIVSAALIGCGLSCSLGIVIVYMMALRNLKRRQIALHGPGLAQNRVMRRVFRTISLLMLFYFLLIVLPLLIGAVIMALQSSEEMRGFISIGVGVGSDLNSCVGIFIYLLKHDELRGFVRQLWPRKITPKLTTGGPKSSDISIVAVMVPSSPSRTPITV